MEVSGAPQRYIGHVGADASGNDFLVRREISKFARAASCFEACWCLGAGGRVPYFQRILVLVYRPGTYRKGTLDMLVQAGTLDLTLENWRALRPVGAAPCFEACWRLGSGGREPSL